MSRVLRPAVAAGAFVSGACLRGELSVEDLNELVRRCFTGTGDTDRANFHMNKELN